VPDATADTPGADAPMPDMSGPAAEETELDDIEPEDIEPQAPPPPDPPPAARIPEEPPMADALYALPGAGPGLVWMLGRAGISSLEDLAAADKDALTKKLGLVGEILDLDYWIDWAAKSSADTR
jgi:predicted flap endonuclease-1-like 5' DNA nuclease